MPGALAIEYQGTEVVENLSLLFVPGSQVSCSLSERFHTIPSLPFVCNLSIEVLPIVLDIHSQTHF